MSTANTLLLIDDERKAQLDLLNQIDASGKNQFVEECIAECSRF